VNFENVAQLIRPSQSKGNQKLKEMRFKKMAFAFELEISENESLPVLDFSGLNCGYVSRIRRVDHLNLEILKIPSRLSLSNVFDSWKSKDGVCVFLIVVQFDQSNHKKTRTKNQTNKQTNKNKKKTKKQNKKTKQKNKTNTKQNNTKTNKTKQNKTKQN